MYCWGGGRLFIREEEESMIRRDDSNKVDAIDKYKFEKCQSEYVLDEIGLDGYAGGGFDFACFYIQSVSESLFFNCSGVTYGRELFVLINGKDKFVDS